MHVKLQAIVGELHMMPSELAEALVGLRVRQIVSDVREPRATRSKLLNKGERLLDGLVHGVRDVAEGVENEVVEIFQQSGGGRGQGTEIGEVGGAAETKTEDFEIAVAQRHRDDWHAKKFERAVDDVEGDARNRAERRRFIEDVRKCAAEDLEGLCGTVHGDCALLADVKGANVVEPEDVIGVAVGEEDGVEAIETDAQGLLAKVGRGVDDYVLLVSRKEQRRTETIIAGIFGGADTAMAAERRHAHGSAGAENGEFYGSGGHGRIRLYLEMAELARLGASSLLSQVWAGLLFKSGGKTAALQGQQDTSAASGSLLWLGLLLARRRPG